MRPCLWVVDTHTSCVDTFHVYLLVCLCDVEVDVVCGTGDLMRVLIVSGGCELYPYPVLPRFVLFLSGEARDCGRP